MPMRILGRGRDHYVIAGYLQKRGRWPWQWAERYFVLTPSALHYYKKEKNQLFGEERGHFLVEDMNIRPLPDKRCFEIFCQEKSRILKAASEREFLTWAKAFEDAQTQIKTKGQRRTREKKDRTEPAKAAAAAGESQNSQPPLVRAVTLPDSSSNGLAAPSHSPKRRGLDENHPLSASASLVAPFNNSGSQSRESSLSRNSGAEGQQHLEELKLTGSESSSTLSLVSHEPLLLVTVEFPSSDSAGSIPSEKVEMIAGRSVDWNHQLFVPSFDDAENSRAVAIGAIVATLSDGTKVRVDRASLESNRGEKQIIVDDPYRPISVRIRWNTVAAPVSPEVTKRFAQRLILPILLILCLFANLTSFNTPAHWITILISLAIAYQIIATEWNRFLLARSAKLFFITFVSMKLRESVQPRTGSPALGGSRYARRQVSNKSIGGAESNSNSVDTSESDQESRGGSSGMKNRRNQKSPHKNNRVAYPNPNPSSRTTASELSSLSIADNNSHHSSPSFSAVSQSPNVPRIPSNPASQPGSRRSSISNSNPQLLAQSSTSNSSLSLAAAQIVSAAASIAHSPQPHSQQPQTQSNNSTGTISRPSPSNEAAETAAFLQAGNTIVGFGSELDDSKSPSAIRQRSGSAVDNQKSNGSAPVSPKSHDKKFNLAAPHHSASRSHSAGIPRLSIDEDCKTDYNSQSFSPIDSTASSASYDDESIDTEQEPFADDIESGDSSASASAEPGPLDFHDSKTSLDPVLKGQLPPSREAPWGRWTEDDTSKLTIRGPTFKMDKIKIPCGISVYKLAHVDQFHTGKEKFYHVGSRVDSYASLRYEWKSRSLAGKRGDHDLSPMIIVNLMYPGPEDKNYNLVLYFVRRVRPAELLIKERNSSESSAESGMDSPRSIAANLLDIPRVTAFDRVLTQFLADGAHSDEFRDCRFKIIPRIAEGPWIVRKGVGCTPAILGKKISQSYHRDRVKNYFEIDADVGSSIVAGKILQLVKSAATSLVIELSFVLQGETPEELPESMMGGCRLLNVDLAKILHYDENVKHNNVILV